MTHMLVELAGLSANPDSYGWALLQASFDALLAALWICVLGGALLTLAALLALLCAGYTTRERQAWRSGRAAQPAQSALVRRRQLAPVLEG
jgi:hypothetical protein